ncbi:hypothetical protein Pyn_16284 [Prunus yedoensis var. nudiflora]|uniref:Uncharacterized protein n=1 Tax=Prunus yedoensis var. nudiflora TaxID=2094558 RepID=A0A314Z173_PRUYE|nr:hypothetical protein Pyn_16284 [Prunus yedoensis var. nudiflora]
MPSLYNINAPSPTLSKAARNVNTKHAAAGRRIKYSPGTCFSLEMLWASFSLSQEKGQQKLDSPLYGGPRLNKPEQAFRRKKTPTVINIHMYTSSIDK